MPHANKRVAELPALDFTRPPRPAEFDSLVAKALEEDVGSGDITSRLTIPEGKLARARLVARKPGTIAGLIAAEAAFRLTDATIRFEALVPDGSKVEAGAVLARIWGPARGILTGERVALNFLNHLSGVATATAALVAAVAGTKARISDTRKTLPGLRLMQKYAVRCGGGVNHRFGLYDAVLIKDNHIAAAGGIAAALKAAKAGVAAGTRIEIEVDDLGQLEEALAGAADIVLLDNMSLEDLRRAVAINKGRAVLEASGNVTLATVRAIAETGVDVISSGGLTHSAPSLDVGLDF